MVRNQSNGFVLHTRPYRNTSAILDIFTKDHGRIQVLAKGIKNIKSRYYSQLHQFQELHIAWQGNGDLYTLTNAEQIKSNNNIVASLGKSNIALTSACYCNELILRFFEKEDPHRDLYIFYSHTLTKLASCRQIEIDLRLFEKELLLQSGYAFDLLYDAGTGEALEENNEYYFSPDIGASKEKLNSMQSDYKVSGKTLLALASNMLQDELVLKEAKHLMRFVIASHLGDRPLNTRKFVMQETL